MKSKFQFLAAVLFGATALASRGASLTLNMQPGDAVVFYTDGVNEAFNPQRECYGNDRLLSDLAASTGATAPAVLARLRENVRTFSDGAPQSDDIAVLVLRLADSPTA